MSLTIQLNISHFFTQLNDHTVVFETIIFSMSHLFALSLNVKQFYVTPRVDMGAMIIKEYSVFQEASALG